MHILFLTDNFFPETNAPASRTHDHAKEWIKAGHKVTVITCVPNFPNGKVYSGYQNKLWQKEIIDNISVIRVWSFIAANQGFTKRIFDYISYMITSFLASFFVFKVDIVVGTSPQFFTAISAWMVSGFKQKPFVFEVRDLWPDSVHAVGAMQDSKLLSIFKRFEIFLYSRADAIVTVTHSFKRNLESRGVSCKKIHVVTNGVEVENFKPREKNKKLVASLGLVDKFLVGYVGTHGMAHALETVLETARLIQKQTDKINFLFLGSGSKKKKLIKTAEALELKNVIFLDNVSKANVVEYLSILDVSLTHLKKVDLFKSVIPSKIFESMAMGIPILHGVEGESADIILDNNVGVTFESENSTELYNVIMKLHHNPNILKKLRSNGPKTAKKFDRIKMAALMLRILQKQ